MLPENDIRNPHVLLIMFISVIPSKKYKKIK